MAVDQRRVGSPIAKLAPDRSRWHGHLGGSHTILTTSVNGIRFLRADITKLAPEGSRWHGHLGGWHAILTTSVVDRVLQAVYGPHLGRFD